LCCVCIPLIRVLGGVGSSTSSSRCKDIYLHRHFPFPPPPDSSLSKSSQSIKAALLSNMLIQESHADVQTVANGKESTMRTMPLLLSCPHVEELIYLIHDVRHIFFSPSNPWIPKSVWPSHKPHERFRTYNMMGIENSPECASSVRSIRVWNHVHLSTTYSGGTLRLTNTQSHWSRCTVRSSDRRPRLHRRRPVLIPRLHRARTPEVRRRRHGPGQQVQG
jgi:hypothetical protein